MKKEGKTMDTNVKKADFRKVPVESIEGKVENIDFSKNLGNAIYQQSKDLGEVELARQMYKTGQINLTPENKAIVEKYIADYPYILRVGIQKVLS